jgi:hypothetical protein
VFVEAVDDDIDSELLQRGQSDLAEDMGFQRRAEIVDGDPDRDRSRGVSCRGGDDGAEPFLDNVGFPGSQRPVQDPQLAAAEPLQCTRNMRAVVQCALYLSIGEASAATPMQHAFIGHRPCTR